MKKIFTILIILTVQAFFASAQQQPIYSQYMMNPYLINPAIAGHKGYADFNLTAREQWLGYSDAPSTYALSGQSRILKTSFMNRNRMIKHRVRRRRPSGRVGYGGYIFNDVNGSIRRTGLQGTYAYHIFVRNIQYSAGVSLSAFQFKVNLSEQSFYEPNFEQEIISQLGKAYFSPDANVGFLMSSDDFYAGISATSLFQTSIQFGLGSPRTAYRLLRHYYLLGGYTYQPERSDYKLEPSMLVTFTERLTWSIDFNLKAYYMEDYWAGFSYRSTGTFISMFGVRYQRYYFGYAFDYSWGDITNFNKMGSHEIMLGMRFGDSARRYRWLNRF